MSARVDSTRGAWKPVPVKAPEGELLPCGECGMLVGWGDFHPFAACLMFRGCGDADTVRVNLHALQCHWLAQTEVAR